MKRYENKNLNVFARELIKDMSTKSKSWIAPHKSAFFKVVEGREILVLRCLYSHDEPVQVFIDKCEIENLTEKERSIIAAEFDHLRHKFTAYIAKSQNTDYLKRKYHIV